MIRKVFLIGIFLITLIIFVLYVVQERDHQRELYKIKSIEERNKKRQRELELIRERSSPCPIPNLNDSRSCYFKSDFKCSWNQDAERCDTR